MSMIVPELKYLEKEDVSRLDIHIGENSGKAIYVTPDLKVYFYTFIKDDFFKRILISDFEEIDKDSGTHKLLNIDVTNIYRKSPERAMNVIKSGEGNDYGRKPMMVLFGENFRNNSSSFNKTAEKKIELLHEYKILLHGLPKELMFVREDLFHYVLTSETTPGVEVLLMALEFKKPKSKEDKSDYGKTEN